MRYLRSFRLYESENNLEKEILSYYDDIVEILDDWSSGYDFKFYEGLRRRDILQFIISPKGYPDHHKSINPIHIDKYVLECFKTLDYFMELNFGLVYSHSYYFCDHNYHEINSDIFKSEGKLVTMVQLFYKLKDGQSFNNQENKSDESFPY